MKKIYIGLSRDHSASMSSITSPAMNDYNTQIAAFRTAALTHNIDTVVSVVRCGDYSRNVLQASRGVVREATLSSVVILDQLNHYVANGAGTPLYDSIGELINQFTQMPDANDPDVQFMIMVITDGDENDSVKWSRSALATRIAELQATNKWTFTFRVPPRTGERLQSNLGLYSGNVLEWSTDRAGLEKSTVATAQAVERYFTEAKAGTRSTTRFYTNLNEVSTQQIKDTLEDITSEVTAWKVANAIEGNSIREFCELKSGKPYLKGAGFYQLTKTESEVQDYKLIVIRDRSTGKVFTGPAARQLLNLPTTGTCRVSPGEHGKYDIFFQSTSVNRKLPTGTTVLYWTGVGQQLKTTKTTAAAPTPDKKNLVKAPGGLPDPDVAQPNIKKSAFGGVISGKPTAPVGSNVHFVVAYKAGYKAGRGKQKNRNGDYSGPANAAYIEGFADGKAKKASRHP